MLKDFDGCKTLGQALGFRAFAVALAGWTASCLMQPSRWLFCRPHRRSKNSANRASAAVLRPGGNWKANGSPDSVKQLVKER